MSRELYMSHLVIWSYTYFISEPLKILKNFTYIYIKHIYYVIMKYCFLRKKTCLFLFHYNLYAIKISLRISNVQIYLRIVKMRFYKLIFGRYEM